MTCEGNETAGKICHWFLKGKAMPLLQLQLILPSSLPLYGCSQRNVIYEPFQTSLFWRVQTHTLADNAKNKYESKLQL